MRGIRRVKIACFLISVMSPSSDKMIYFVYLSTSLNVDVLKQFIVYYEVTKSSMKGLLRFKKFVLLP